MICCRYTDLIVSIFEFRYRWLPWAVVAKAEGWLPELPAPLVVTEGYERQRFNTMVAYLKILSASDDGDDEVQAL